MDRRSFIKNTIIAGTAFTAGVMANESFLKNKKLKIFVLTGSPRKNGNSNTLVEYFIKGAKEKGHNVIRFDSAFKNVHPCTACDKCKNGDNCVIDDDFNFVRDNMVDADVVVIATPLYIFGFSAQIKAVLDRSYSLFSKLHSPKKSIFILAHSCVDEREKPGSIIIEHYRKIVEFYGWTNVGEIVSKGFWDAGGVLNSEYPQQAYDLGKSL